MKIQNSVILGGGLDTTPQKPQWTSTCHFVKVCFGTWSSAVESLVEVSLTIPEKIAILWRKKVKNSQNGNFEVTLTLNQKVKFKKIDIKNLISLRTTSLPNIIQIFEKKMKIQNSVILGGGLDTTPQKPQWTSTCHFVKVCFGTWSSAVESLVEVSLTIPEKIAILWRKKVKNSQNGNFEVTLTLNQKVKFKKIDIKNLISLRTTSLPNIIQIFEKKGQRNNNNKEE